MSTEERSDNSGHTDDSGSDSEEDVSGEHVISSTEECQPPYYEHIEENEYLFDRKKKVNKEVRRMQCDCTLDSDDPSSSGCGEDCLNRLLMIECNSRCACGEMCSNKRFQQGCKVKVEVFKTEKKGWGLRTLEDLESNQFVMEYCGEVMNYKDFQERAERYDRENRRHYYFMTLRADELIDATYKGNLSRFINHSCDSNCETQKWTVHGLLRIGFFTQRPIPAGAELTFDYKLQRYGKVAQICHCEAPNCRGFIGGDKQTPLKNTVERIATPPITSSPRRRRKKQTRNLTNEFDDMTLEDEVEKLLGEHRGLVHSDQALKLSRLMVQAETMEQRIMLLKILQHTTDQSCLKGFLRYQGLSLLWSWMVDGGGKKTKLQLELLETLKCLPIATKNQLEDSKVIKVVRKWASSFCPTAEAGSSSGQESHGNSPADSECTAGTEDNDEESQQLSKSIDGDKKAIGIPVSLFERQSSNKDQSDDESLDAEVASFIVDKTLDSRAMKNKLLSENFEKSPDDLSEDDLKFEDERLPEIGIGLMANELLKTWSLLKEVYRIPKKTATPAKQDRVTELLVAASPAGSGDGDHARTPIENIGSPGKLDAIMKSLQDSPKPLYPSESRTPPVSQGFSTFSEDTEMLQDSSSATPPSKTGDFSALEFGEDVGTQGDSTPDKGEGAQPSSQVSDSVEVPHKQDSKSQNTMQTFGYQQRMSVGVEHGLGAFKHKPSKKKKKKWNQLHNVFQQKGRNPQGSVDKNGGNFNMNPQTNLRPQQAAATQWRGQSQNPHANFQVGNQFFCSSGPTVGQDQGPRPQNIVSGNFLGNFSQQPPPLPNFNVPPPNMSPMEFFRKVPPPNLRQQTHPMIPQQLQPSPLIAPPQPVPPPPLQNNQSQFFPPSQPTPPYSRLPPPPPFQANVTTPPPTQFSHSNPNPIQQQFPQSMQAGFPPQQNQFQFNTPPPNLGITAAQQGNSVGIVTGSLQRQSGPMESVSHPEVGSLSVQTGAVTTSMSETFESREGFPSDSEPCTPSPVKHKPPDHLPPHWKSATDSQGKVYYYHALTRKTQWDVPSWDSSPSSEEEHPYKVPEPDHTSISSHSYIDMDEDSPPKPKIKKLAKAPSTPPETPPESPTLTYTTAPADTTAHRRGGHLLRDSTSSSSSSHQSKNRELFRMKLSNVVVNCLNPFFKVDCKSGRILNTDDFKFLARKLTHGILSKEMSHLKDDDTLQCNDSVKIKTKEYIKNYMKKFGPVYKRS